MLSVKSYYCLSKFTKNIHTENSFKISLLPQKPSHFFSHFRKNRCEFNLVRRIALDSLMVFKSKSGVFWGFYRTPENQRDEQAIQKSLDRCNEHFGLLDKLLTGQKYLGGREFSLADIPAGTNLYRYFTLDIKRPKLPNVERWYARLQERPSYRENVMIPYSGYK